MSRLDSRRYFIIIVINQSFECPAGQPNLLIVALLVVRRGAALAVRSAHRSESRINYK